NLVVEKADAEPFLGRRAAGESERQRGDGSDVEGSKKILAPHGAEDSRGWLAAPPEDEFSGVA
ncbi:MAG: hypothetical protein V3T72_04855, partial [Thermoanaerobaculia bacterium]